MSIASSCPLSHLSFFLHHILRNSRHFVVWLTEIWCQRGIAVVTSRWKKFLLGIHEEKVEIGNRFYQLKTELAAIMKDSVVTCVVFKLVAAVLAAAWLARWYTTGRMLLCTQKTGTWYCTFKPAAGVNYCSSLQHGGRTKQPGLIYYFLRGQFH
jgi:hypothetical protein